jgi:hypothetical protein
MKTMKMDWGTVKAHHVSQACDTLLKSTRPGAKPSRLIVVHKDQQLPAKEVLRLAYRLANNLPPETKLKFASGENSLQLLRSLGFQAERMNSNTPQLSKN